MNSIRKYVFSATLDQAGWNNSVILRGDAVAEVTRLKQQDGGELAVYGHGRLAQALYVHDRVIHALSTGRAKRRGHASARPERRGKPQCGADGSSPYCHRRM
jgi:hypothetical protein